MKLSQVVKYLISKIWMKYSIQKFNLDSSSRPLINQTSYLPDLSDLLYKITTVKKEIEYILVF